MKLLKHSFAFLLIGLFAFSGCTTCTVVQSTCHPSKVKPFKTPKKLLCISKIDYLSKGETIDVNVLNKVLNKHYPNVFARVITEEYQHVGLYYDSQITDEHRLSGLLTYPTFFASGFILPRVDSFDVESSINLTRNKDGKALASLPTLKNKREYTQHYSWFFSNWIFFTRFNFGRFWFCDREEDPAPDLYDALAAQIMVAYNSNFDFFNEPEQKSEPKRTLRTSNKAKEAPAKTVPAVSEKVKQTPTRSADEKYTILRRQFDVQTNTGKWRIQFAEPKPSSAELVDIQEQLRKMCFDSFLENNTGASAENILILKEDYRAIGKSLKMYEFSLTLGVLEFLGIQYDNRTLHGVITVKIPGGYPTVARKWVTENLDALVEEYNVSADDFIEGDYQLTSEKMDADGTYTVAFEVVN